MSRVLVIGDPHEPVAHPGYLAFCQDLYEQWDCNEVVIIGDLADQQAISFHAANPMCPGPDDEFKLTYNAMQKWYKVFPDAKVCIGNHDERVMRLAESVKIPAKYLRNFNEVWKTSRWTWDYEFFIDNAIYFHGTGRSGIHPAWNAIAKKMQSVVMGHCHARAGAKWVANGRERFFGLDTGCGINVDAFQFAYGKNCDVRPFLAAGVVIDMIPYSEPMPCSPKEKYHKSRFAK